MQNWILLLGTLLDRERARICRKTLRSESVKSSKLYTALLATTIILLCTTASSARTAGLHIVLVKAGVILPGHDGGTLFYRGRRWRIEIGGIDVSTISAPRIDLTGTVSHFRAVEDVLGAYNTVDGQRAVASEGAVVRLKNPAGALLELRAAKRQISIDIDGITIAGRGWNNKVH